MKTILTQVTCDICTKETDLTECIVQVDNQRVVVDLCTEHRAKLNKAVAPFLEAGRKDRLPKTGKTVKRDTTAIRAWAKEAGHSVSERGRIPQQVEALYHESH